MIKWFLWWDNYPGAQKNWLFFSEWRKQQVELKGCLFESLLGRWSSLWRFWATMASVLPRSEWWSRQFHTRFLTHLMWMWIRLQAQPGFNWVVHFYIVHVDLHLHWQLVGRPCNGNNGSEGEGTSRATFSRSCWVWLQLFTSGTSRSVVCV